MAVRLSRGQHSYQYLFSFCNVALFYCQRKRVTIAFSKPNLELLHLCFIKYLGRTSTTLLAHLLGKKGYFVVPGVIQEHLNFFKKISCRRKCWYKTYNSFYPNVLCAISRDNSDRSDHFKKITYQENHPTHVQCPMSSLWEIEVN